MKPLNNEKLRRQRNNAEVSIPGILRTLLRGLPLLLVCACVFGGMGYVYARRSEPSYSVDFTVLVDIADEPDSQDTIAVIASGNKNSRVTIAREYAFSYIEILRSQAMTTKALEEAGLEDAYDWKTVSRGISGEVPVSTAVLKITLTMNDAEAVYRVGNALAGIASADLADILDGSRAELLTMPEKPQVSGNSGIKTAIKFAAAGLLLGVLFLVLLEIFTSRAGGKKDIEERCGLPVIGQVPSARKNAPEMKTAVLAEYEQLARNIEYSMPQNGGRAVFFISAENEAGRELHAEYCAAALAASGRKVILLEADMETEGTVRNTGLSDILALGTDWKTVVRTDDNGLDRIAAGHRSADPAGLIGSENMHALLRELKESYAYIIVDVPALLHMEEDAAKQFEADGCVFVVCRNKTLRADIEECSERFRMTGVNMIGVLIQG